MTRINRSIYTTLFYSLILFLLSLHCVTAQETDTFVDSCEAYKQQPEKLKHYLNKKKLISDKNTHNDGFEGYYWFYSALTQHREGMPEKAAELYQKASKQFNHNNNLTAKAKSNLYLGILLKEQNQFSEATKEILKASGIYESLKDSGGMASAENYLGSLSLNQGHLDSAIFHYQKSLGLLTKLNDTMGKAKSYENIGLAYREKGDFETSNDFNFKALDIYSLLADTFKMAGSYNLIGSVNWRSRNYQKALQYYDKAHTLYLAVNEELTAAKVLNNIGRTYKDMKENQKADSIFTEALNIFKKLSDLKGVNASLNNLGNSHWERRELPTALAYYLDSYALQDTLGDLAGKALLLRNLGNIYLAVKNYDQALEYYHQALELEKQIQNQSRIAYVTILMGDVYGELRDFSQARKIYLEAMAYFRNSDNKKSMAQMYDRLGSSYFEEKEFKQALKNYNLALNLGVETADTWRQGMEYNNLGNVYASQGNTTESYAYFTKALKAFQEADYSFGEALSYRKLGEVYLNEKKEALALSMFQHSLALGETLKNQEVIKQALFGIYETHQERKDYKSALEAFKRFSMVNDSIDLKINNQKLAELQMNFEVKKREAIIEEIEIQNQALEMEKKITELQLVKQKSLRNMLLISIIAVIAVSLLLYNRYLLKKKTEKELQELNQTKDKFFSIIAHDLKNPMAGIVIAATTLKNNYDTFDDTQRKGFNDILYQSAIHLEGLLTNLLEWSRSHRGKIQFTPEQINLEKLVENNISLVKLNADKKQLTIDKDVPHEIHIHADESMINTVFRNLISNAIKFTPKGGKIYIGVTKLEKSVEFFVRDTGVGIPETALPKLFRIDESHSTYGTEDEGGTGLGLVLCKEFIDKHSGELSVKSDVGKGTQFTVKLPQ